MRRTLIVSAIVVAVLWVAAVAVRLLLPWGAHLVGLADTILYWVAAAATVVLTAIGFYTLLRRQPPLMRIAGWAFYLLIGLEGMLLAAIIGSTTSLFNALPEAKVVDIDNRYLVRSDFWYGYVLYERDGLVERRLTGIQFGWYLDEEHVDNLRVAVCPKHELLLIECDDRPEDLPTDEDAAVPTRAHHRYLQAFDGSQYDDVETIVLLEKCPELQR